MSESSSTFLTLSSLLSPEKLPLGTIPVFVESALSICSSLGLNTQPDRIQPPRTRGFFLRLWEDLFLCSLRCWQVLCYSTRAPFSCWLTNKDLPSTGVTCLLWLRASSNFKASFVGESLSYWESLPLLQCHLCDLLVCLFLPFLKSSCD